MIFDAFLIPSQAVDDIYYDMDMDHTADISPGEMLAWSKRGNNIVDRLADIIDQEVYQIWLAESKKRSKMERQAGARRFNDQPGAFQSGQPTSPMSSDYGPSPSSPQGNGSGWFGGYFNAQDSPASRRGLQKSERIECFEC